MHLKQAELQKRNEVIAELKKQAESQSERIAAQKEEIRALRASSARNSSMDSVTVKQ